MKPKRFEEKDGRVVIPIYEYNDGRFCVDAVVGGKRKRITRTALADARLEARKIIAQVKAGRSDETLLSSAEVEDYRLAKGKLAGYNRSLLAVIEEWIELHERKKKLIEKDVPDVVEEFLAAKKLEGLSSVHLADCQARLRKFAKAFPSRIERITTREVAQWLVKLGTAKRTQKNYRNLVLQLFRFARSRQYLPAKEATAVDDVTLGNVQEGEILIYTPDELNLLLANAPDRLLPFICIGALAGLRSQEIMRLEWEDIRFEQNYIEVSAKKAKTASRRLVPLAPTLKALLLPHRADSGRVMKYAHNAALTRARIQFCERGVEVNRRRKPFVWKANALRHSYASYRLAEIKDAARVALEMGNSPSMLFRNYRELVTEAEAVRWFALRPQAENLEASASRVAA